MSGAPKAGEEPPASGAAKLSPAEARRGRVRTLRGLLLAFAVTSGVAVFCALYLRPLFLVAVLAPIIIALSFFLLLMQKCTVEGDTMYGLLIPISALFGGERLGGFGPADVVSAEVVRTRMQGYGTYTSLFVRSRFGDLAGFGGAPDVAPGEMEEMTDPALRKLLEERLEEERGDLALGLDWLRDHGIAVGLSTARGERLRVRRHARIMIIGGMALAAIVPVAGVLLEFVGVLARFDAISTVITALLILTITIGAARGLMRAGVAVSGDTIFPQRLPFRALWDPSALGGASAADVLSWSARAPRWSEAKGEGRVLDVRIRRRGRSRVLQLSDRAAFDQVEGWLAEHCPETRRG